MSFATISVPRASLYGLLVAAAGTCFVGALAGDLAYWRSASMQWETFSVWLLTFGLVITGLAVLALVVESIGPRSRVLVPFWPSLVCHGLAAVLGLLNAFVHSRDGYVAVVPEGLVLSGATVLVMLLAGRARPGLRLIVAAVVSVAAAGWVLANALLMPPRAAAGSQMGAQAALPVPHNYLLPPVAVAPQAAWGSATPTVPAGFGIRAYASGLSHPRSVYPLPNGDVLVVESNGPAAPVYRPKDLIMGLVKTHAGAAAKAANRILLLRDADGDGVAETRSVLIDHLISPFGVALVGSDLYVADTDAILRFPYVEGQTSIERAGEKLADLPGGPIDHHWTKSLVASPDGKMLYVGVGSNSNITENGIGAELGRAAIWQIDRKTGAGRIFASGLRNPNGLQWEPQSGALWAVINERDEIGPDLVPDYLTSVRDGGFYGWPYSYYGQHVDARVQPQRPDLVAKAIVPDYALGSHLAPLGLAFNTGTAMPEAYRGGAFVGEHGSWDRQPLSGYKVVFVPFSGGHPSGAAQDFVTGFLTPDKSHARGRPVALAVDKAGALLIADDLGNAVWRVTASR